MVKRNKKHSQSFVKKIHVLSVERKGPCIDEQYKQYAVKSAVNTNTMLLNQHIIASGYITLFMKCYGTNLQLSIRSKKKANYSEYLEDARQQPQC